jgi:uncharacterized cupin superfamily protein
VSVLHVAAGHDRLGEHRGLGISTIQFKVTLQDCEGGPPKHLHHAQDEWFYCLEGEFVLEVGEKRFDLRPGDSVLAPRQIPHVWAHVGETTGRMLITFTPAGQMEAFFREVNKANAMPPQTPELWSAYGMQLLGTPLRV